MNLQVVRPLTDSYVTDQLYWIHVISRWIIIWPTLGKTCASEECGGWFYIDSHTECKLRGHHLFITSFLLLVLIIFCRCLVCASVNSWLFTYIFFSVFHFSSLFSSTSPFIHFYGFRLFFFSHFPSLIPYPSPCVLFPSATIHDPVFFFLCSSFFVLLCFSVPSSFYFFSTFVFIFSIKRWKSRRRNSEATTLKYRWRFTI